MEKDKPKKARSSPRYWAEINGCLYARFQYKGDDGKYKVKYKPIKDKRLAKGVVAAMKRELEEHGQETLSSDKMTLRQLAAIYEKERVIPAQYLNGVKVAGRKSVLPVKRNIRTLTEYLGDKPIRQIKGVDIERFKKARLNTPTIYGRQRQIASVNRELEQLRTMFNFAIQNEWLLRNPFTFMKGIISKAAEVERDRILSVEEEERLLQACAGRCSHMRPILICALDTAMRRGEIFKMRWADVSFDRNEILIPQTNTKTEKTRIVGMTKRLCDELQVLWECSPKDPQYIVFGIADNVKNAFRSVCEAAGITDFRFHDCRHTATTRMIMAGCSHTEVMKITGHSQLTTFLRYLNIKTETTNRVAAALEAYLSTAAEVGIISESVQ